MSTRLLRIPVLIGLVLTLTACGNGLLRPAGERTPEDQQRLARTGEEPQRETIWNLFERTDDPNTTVEVNKYLWVAAQDILDFMPIEAVDPFTGVIVYGYGTPPGGGTAYRATVYVQDPALEARSIRVALATRGGPVPRATARAIEDAILTRARQLRIQDRGL
jgi:hypothetical protein